jgi:hypothetical protein
MSIFLKKKKGNLESNGFLKCKQTQIADRLHRRINSCSPLQKKMGLFIFCLLSGAFCFYMLTRLVLSRSVKAQILIITPLRSAMPLPYRDSLRLKEIMLENMFHSKIK